MILVRRLRAITTGVAKMLRVKSPTSAPTRTKPKAANPTQRIHAQRTKDNVKPAIRSFGDSHPGTDPRIRCRHHRKQAFDLVEVFDEFRSRQDIPSAQPNPHRLALLQIQLPFASTWGE